MNILEAIQKSLTDPMIIWGKLAGILPNIFAAILLLAGGHFLGKITANIVSRLLKKAGLDTVSENAGIGDAVRNTGFDTLPSTLVGKVVYWLIFLTFILSAADILGLERVSATINNFVLYLPKIVGALLVVVFGLFVAGLVRSSIETTLGTINLGYEKVIGSTIHALMVIVVVSLAIGQLDIETDLLNQVVVIFLLAGGVAIALALGLGTRDVAGSVVAGVYARELYQPGQVIKVGDIRGTVVEVGSTSLLLVMDDGKKVAIPNRRVLDEQIEIFS